MALMKEILWHRKEGGGGELGRPDRAVSLPAMLSEHSPRVRAITTLSRGTRERGRELKYPFIFLIMPNKRGSSFMFHFFVEQGHMECTYLDVVLTS